MSRKETPDHQPRYMPGNQPSWQSSQQFVNHSVNQAAFRPQNEARDHPAYRPHDKARNQTAFRPQNEARDQPALRQQNEARDQPTFRPQNEARDQPTFRLHNEARDQPTFRPQNEARDQPAFRQQNEARDQPAFRQQNEARDQPAFRPHDEARDQPAFRPQNEARDQPAFRPHNEARNQPTFRPQNEARDQPTFRPQNEARDQPAFRQQNEARDQPTFRPQNEARDQPAFRQQNEARDQPAFRQQNEAMDKPAENLMLPESFFWYDKTLTLRELVDQFADHVPFLIKFMTGYYGRDEDINYISAHETAWLHDIVAQERVAFTDSRNRHYSIPTQSAQKVHPVTANGRDPALVTIPQLMAAHTIRRFQFPAATLRNKLLCFKGPEDGHAMEDDVYNILETYREQFITIHAMTNTGLYESYILMPVYMPVDVVIAVGDTTGSVNRFHEQMLTLKDVADVCPHDYRRHMEAISGILFFDHKPVDTEYEALMPIGQFSRDNFYESMTQENKSPSGSAKSSRDPGWRSMRHKGDVASSLSNRIALGLDVPKLSQKPRVQIMAFTLRILEELQNTYQTRVLPSGEYMERLTKVARKKLTCREAPNIRHQGQDLATRPLTVGSNPLASIARFADTYYVHSPAAQRDPPSPRAGHGIPPPLPPPRVNKEAHRGSPGMAPPPARTDKFKRSQSHSSASPDTPTRPIGSHSSHNNAPTANCEPSSTTRPRQPSAQLAQGAKLSSGPAGKHKRISSIADIPSDITSLGAEQIGQCLTLLKLDKYRKILKQNQVDGELLQTLDEGTLHRNFGMDEFDATKLVIFRQGWRPK